MGRMRSGLEAVISPFAQPPSPQQRRQHAPRLGGRQQPQHAREHLILAKVPGQAEQRWGPAACVEHALVLTSLCTLDGKKG